MESTSILCKFLRIRRITEFSGSVFVRSFEILHKMCDWIFGFSSETITVVAVFSINCWFLIIFYFVFHFNYLFFVLYKRITDWMSYCVFFFISVINYFNDSCSLGIYYFASKSFGMEFPFLWVLHTTLQLNSNLIIEITSISLLNRSRNSGIISNQKLIVFVSRYTSACASVFVSMCNMYTMLYVFINIISVFTQVLPIFV